MSQPEQWHSARGRRSGDVEENHQTDQFIGQNDEDNENEPVPKANRRASNKNVKKAAKIVVLDDSDEEELLDDDGHVSDSEDDDDDSDESPPPKKTKARVPEKRDRGKVVAPVPVPAAPAAAKDENVAPADKPKTGRGRPRKKGTGVGATTGRQDDAPKVPDPTIAGSLDGGKAVAVLKESDPNISGRPRPTTAGPIEKAAGCVTQNDQKTAAAATGDEAKQDASKAKTTTEASKKPPAPSSQPGRVVYRVGLSKTSRIAPLLKIIRK